MGSPSSALPALPPRAPHPSSSSLLLAPVPVTAPDTRTPAGPPPPLRSPVVVAAAAPAPVVDTGVGAIPIVFAAAAATHRETIREEARRKKAQTKQGKELLSAAATTKRKASRVKQSKAPPAKRLKSPMVSVSPLGPARSTGVRMMLSPRTITPSTELLSSSQESPVSPFVRKRSNLHHGAHRFTCFNSSMVSQNMASRSALWQ